jgi:hypothetical protein
MIFMVARYRMSNIGIRQNAMMMFFFRITRIPPGIRNSNPHLIFVQARFDIFPSRKGKARIIFRCREVAGETPKRHPPGS